MIRSQFPKFSLQEGNRGTFQSSVSPGHGELVLDGNQKPCQEAVHASKPGIHFPALLCHCGALLEV